MDTCVLIWYFDNDKRAKSLAEDIEYYQADYAVSIETLKELLYLIQYSKIRLDISFEGLIKHLEELYVRIEFDDLETLDVLASLPAYKNHTDPVDRQIIATAIAKRRILISGDEKFNLYTAHGLAFLEV